MRALVVVLLVGGCGGDARSPEGSGSAKRVGSAAIHRLDLPRVDDPARVLIVTGAKPPALVWISATGAIDVGHAGPAWDGSIAPQHHTVEFPEVRRAVLEAAIVSGGPARQLAEQELRDVDRQAALAEANRAGLIGILPGGATDPGPNRLPGATTIPLDTLAKTAPLVIALPSSPAAEVARVLAVTGGALAVDHAGELAVLGVGFARPEGPKPIGQAAWTEVFADAAGIHVVTRPEDSEKIIAWNGSAIGKGLANAIVRDRQVDVLVRADTTTQTLVDLVVALDALGVHHLVVAGPRVAPVATVTPGHPNAQGDLDKAIIRDKILAVMPKLRTCYEQVLAVRPGLAGTVSVTFFITPTGSVATSHATGVDPGVASCVATVIKTIVFPAPTNGGGVQVHYPFTFREG
ncbi:MAG: AgmX/PglI C-terminal domain-containing protein [Kofleriaceae bacterium]